MADDLRVTQLTGEVVHAGSATYRATQVVAEVIHTAVSFYRPTQVVAEVVYVVGTPSVSERRSFVAGIIG